MNKKALALTVLLATDVLAQSELERLGGGPGGVPQGGAWSAERAGKRRRKAAAPSPAASPAPQASASPAEADDDEAPDISWANGLLSVECENVHIGEFLLELHRQTSIPIHLEPGVEHKVTAKFTGLRLERALPMLFPEGTWQLVRKPGTALRADDGIAGLVIRPQNAAGKARVGGMNFGPAFEIPGEPAASAPPPGDLPVEASVEPPPPVTASASVEPAPVVTAPAVVASVAPAPAPTPDGDAPRKKIEELLEKRKSKK